MNSLLIVSNNSLSETDNNGKTLMNIVKKIPKDRVSQLYFSDDLPEVAGYRYFRISMKDIFHGILHKEHRGQPVYPSDAKVNRDSLSVQRVIKRTAFTLYVRDYIWKRMWEKQQLVSWLDEVKPDVILFLAGDALFPYEICEWIVEHYKCAINIYVTDDYILNRNGETYLEKKRRMEVYKAMKAVVLKSQNFFTICDRMREVYKKEFGVDSKILFNNCLSMYDEALSNDALLNNEEVFLYAGSLYYGRDKVLIELAKVLRRINEEESNKKNVLHIYLNKNPSSEFIDTLKSIGVGDYYGKVGADEVKKILNLCNHPVFVESFDLENIEKVRLSFSTKVPEYLSLNKSILAIGPSEIGSMDCLNGAAVCVDSVESIYEGVKCVIKDDKLYKTKAREKYEALMKHCDIEDYI